MPYLAVILNFWRLAFRSSWLNQLFISYLDGVLIFGAWTTPKPNSSFLFYYTSLLPSSEWPNCTYILAFGWKEGSPKCKAFCSRVINTARCTLHFSLSQPSLFSPLIKVVTEGTVLAHQTLTRALFAQAPFPPFEHSLVLLSGDGYWNMALKAYPRDTPK